MTGIEVEMETREGGNLSGGVGVCVNKPAEYLMSAGTKHFQNKYF